MKKVIVIRKGINTKKLKEKRYSNNRSSIPKILFVGRLVGQKGIFLGLKALKEINQDYEFIIVGSGPLRNRLEQYAKKNRINAKFCGYVSEERLFSLYAKSDILLIPSFYETEPLVAMEGAGTGLPIIGFKSAMIQNIVCEENKKFIVDTGDIKALQKSITYLLENESERKKIGLKNKELILKNFTVERMVNEYISLYNSLIDDSTK